MIEATIVGVIMSFVVQIGKKYVEIAKRYPKVIVVFGTGILLVVYFRTVNASQILLWLHSIASAIMLYEMVVKPAMNPGTPPH